MTGRGGGGGGRRVLLPPINFIFKLLQQHSPVKVWLYEQLGVRIEGKMRVWKFPHLIYSCANMFSSGIR